MKIRKVKVVRVPYLNDMTMEELEEEEKVIEAWQSAKKEAHKMVEEWKNSAKKEVKMNESQETRKWNNGVSLHHE